MMNCVQSGVAYLNEPELVARFQRWFGVHRKKPTATRSATPSQVKDLT